MTNEAILAVHRRTGFEGVAAAAEHFVHRVLTDHLTSAGQSHRYRIRYQHDTAQAQWYVDDQSVYGAVTPLQIECVSLSMGVLRGDDAGVPPVTASVPLSARISATWTPWRATPN